MTKFNLGIVTVLLLAAIAYAVQQHQSRAKVDAENESLHQELTAMDRLRAENQRLSNLLAQAKSIQANVNRQLEALLKSQAQTNQSSSKPAVLPQSANDPSAQIAQLRSEILRLSQQVQDLTKVHEEAPQVAAAPTNAPAADDTPSQPAEPVFLRMIKTQGAAFADKLKRSVGAQDSESFQDVYARFLQSNGIDLTHIAAAAYDERTGNVIIRAAQPTLDEVERLTLALDRSP